MTVSTKNPVEHCSADGAENAESTQGNHMIHSTPPVKNKSKSVECHLVDIRSAAVRWREDQESIIALLTGCLALADQENDFVQIRLLEMASDLSADLESYRRIQDAAEAIEGGCGTYLPDDLV